MMDSPSLLPIYTRRSPRISMEDSVAVTWMSNGRLRRVAGQTRDVSANGVFLYLDSAPIEGSIIQLLLCLPSKVTHTKDSTVFCKARVVRVEPPDANDKIGVAVEIDSYEPLAPA